MVPSFGPNVDEMQAVKDTWGGLCTRLLFFVDFDVKDVKWNDFTVSIIRVQLSL